MTRTLQTVALLGLLTGLLTLPAQSWAQASPDAPRDLGLIPDGEERAIPIRGRLDLATATQEQVNAAVDATLFSISSNSGVCFAATSPEGSVLFFVNTSNADSGQTVFDLNSGEQGLASEEGRRSLIRSIAPIPETRFLLSVLVAQNENAMAESVTLFVRAYPDTTPDSELDPVCGPFRMPTQEADPG